MSPRRLAAVVALAMVAGACGRSDDARQAAALTGGDPDRARAEIRKYGCGTCHTIAGVPGANGKVGPALDGLAERAYVAGVTPNTPANLIAWIEAPRAFAPKTAMPMLGVRPADARDIAAYLYTLR